MNLAVPCAIYWVWTQEPAWGRRSSRFNKITPVPYFYLSFPLPRYLFFSQLAFPWISFTLTLTDFWCAR